MRRTLALFLLAAVIGAAAPPATARRPAKAKGRDRTFYVVPGTDGKQCALSTDRDLVDPSYGCGTPDDAATGMLLGSEPVWFPALDGLPVHLDVSRSIRGKVTVNSRYLVGYLVPGGAGLAGLEITVAGVAGGEEVTVGSFTTEPYPVTPDDMTYEVEFQIEPEASLHGEALTELRLGLEVTGPNVNHNLYYADGNSTMKVPLAR